MAWRIESINWFDRYNWHDLLDEFFKKIDFIVPFLLIYVDDILLALPKDKIEETLAILNSLDPNIKFTCEKETDNAIPFLDLLVIRKEDHISIDFYKKPSSSNRILNYRSHHPLHQKIAIIKQLSHRVKKNCSPEHVDKNINLIKDLLAKNDYPKKLINRILNDQKDDTKQNPNKNNNSGDQETSQRFIRVPFHKNLAPKVNHIFKNTGTKVAFYNTKTVNNLFSKTKDKIPAEDESQVVYKVPCECNKVYFGQTARRVKQRINEHRRDVDIKSTKTGLCQHSTESNHRIKWDELKIVDREPNDEKRCFLEMSHILREGDNSMNVQSDFKVSTKMYNHVLTYFK